MRSTRFSVRTVPSPRELVISRTQMQGGLGRTPGYTEQSALHGCSSPEEKSAVPFPRVGGFPKSSRSVHPYAHGPLPCAPQHIAATQVTKRNTQRN